MACSGDMEAGLMPKILDFAVRFYSNNQATFKPDNMM
jgi:hypothetical protein